MAARGAPVEYLDRPRDTAAVAGTDLYLGAFVDHRAGALQPLSYARELARVAIAGGRADLSAARGCRARRAQRAGWRASLRRRCERARADRARRTNAYADDLVPGLAALDRRRELAADRDRAASAESLRRTILPGGEVLSDTRNIIRYWRLDDDGRLLMGGRGPYREPEAGARLGASRRGRR